MPVSLVSFWRSLMGVIAASFLTALSASAQTSYPSTFTQIGAGVSHTCALSGEGEVWCWGWNYYGQLGDGTLNNRQTPVRVQGLGSGVTELSVGNWHVCALDSRRRAWCWGANWNGELGDGTATHRLTPVRVQGLNGGLTGIAAGYNHSCALNRHGRALCWGYGHEGQLGTGTHDTHLTPVAVRNLNGGLTDIVAGAVHTCALDRHGRALCWGNNDSGELGDGTATNRMTPVPVRGVGRGLTGLDLGASHTCALNRNGRAWCWGGGADGVLGDGSQDGSRLNPVRVRTLTRGGTGLAANQYHSCALDSRGRAWCWGYGMFGAIGDGTTETRLTPVRVQGLNRNLTALAAGGHHSCALDRHGQAWCWGTGQWGQLGAGDVPASWTPVPVVMPVP